MLTYLSMLQNAVWYGTNTGFAAQGYQLQWFLFANSYGDCKIHLGDFTGPEAGGKKTTDIFRSCQNPTLNMIVKGQVAGAVFSNPVPTLTGSQIDNKSNTCRGHVGNFNGDDKDDILRTCNNPFYNAIYLGATNPFAGFGYVLQGSVLENSANGCRIHLGDYNNDGQTDIFRSCNSRCYNSIYLSAIDSGGTFTGGYTLTTGVLENSIETCKLHVGNYNGLGGDDLLRTCNNKFYNALFRSIL